MFLNSSISISLRWWLSARKIVVDSCRILIGMARQHQAFPRRFRPEWMIFLWICWEAGLQRLEVPCRRGIGLMQFRRISSLHCLGFYGAGSIVSLISTPFLLNRSMKTLQGTSVAGERMPSPVISPFTIISATIQAG